MTQAVPSPQLEEIPATAKGWIVEEAPQEEPCRGILVEEVHVDEADTSFVSTTPPQEEEAQRRWWWDGKRRFSIVEINC